ncbi:MAG: hypothetical protein AAGI52_01835 [Bacteroidota bacterium]
MTPLPMLLLSLALFIAAVLLIAAAAARGLSNLDTILKVVEPGDPEFDNSTLRTEV